MNLSYLKRAILLEAGFAAFWGEHYEGRNGNCADIYRQAFVNGAAVNRANNELRALLLQDRPR